MSQRIYVNDVAVRDGFQIEKQFVPTEAKIATINALAKTGLRKIEITAFVSPKAIPNMADAEQVIAGVHAPPPGTQFTVLVPNLRGAERCAQVVHAHAGKVAEINVFMSASESHNLANVNRTRAQSLEGFKDVMTVAKQAGLKVNGSISTSFGCPFEGHVAEQTVLDIAAQLFDMGMHGINVADTTGMANPAQVRRLSKKLVARFPAREITLHFHNTRGMGLANVVAGIEAGIVSYDGSIAGLGGCPYAPGATGNICTEDLVNMLVDMGYDTGVDLDALIAVARGIPTLVHHDVPGQIIKAGKTMTLHPKPEKLYS